MVEPVSPRHAERLPGALLAYALALAAFLNHWTLPEFSKVGLFT
jgi:hypothetical protein